MCGSTANHEVRPAAADQSGTQPRTAFTLVEALLVCQGDLLEISAIALWAAHVHRVTPLQAPLRCSDQSFPSAHRHFLLKLTPEPTLLNPGRWN